jgi:hypothetical protein
MKSTFIKRNFKLHVRTCPVAAHLRPLQANKCAHRKSPCIYGNHSEPLKLVHAFACRLCDLTCIGIFRCTQVDLLQKGKIPGGAGLPPFPL